MTPKGPDVRGEAVITEAFWVPVSVPTACNPNGERRLLFAVTLLLPAKVSLSVNKRATPPLLTKFTKALCSDAESDMITLVSPIADEMSNTFKVPRYAGVRVEVALIVLFGNADAIALRSPAS